MSDRNQLPPESQTQSAPTTTCNCPEWRVRAAVADLVLCKTLQNQGDRANAFLDSHAQ